MRKFLIVLIVLGLAAAVMSSERAQAGVTIKVRALNPLDTEQKAAIHYALPKEISPDDIIEQKVIYSAEAVEGEEPRKTNLAVTLDEESSRYFLHDEVILKPKEIVTIEVRVKDVWTIDPAVFEAMEKDVNGLVDQWNAQNQEAVSGGETDEEAREQQSETHEVVLSLQKEILNNLKTVKDSEEANTIAGVGAENHIEVYKKNLDLLEQAKQDMAVLKSLIAGEHPEEGPAETSPEGAEVPPTENPGSQDGLSPELTGQDRAEEGGLGNVIMDQGLDPDQGKSE